MEEGKRKKKLLKPKRLTDALGKTKRKVLKPDLASNIEKKKKDLNKSTEKLTKTEIFQNFIEEDNSKKDYVENKVLKHRVTHYISEEALEGLEFMFDEFRKVLPYRNKTKIKKSLLIEYALRRVIEDYKINKYESNIYLDLVEQYLINN